MKYGVGAAIVLIVLATSAYTFHGSRESVPGSYIMDNKVDIEAAIAYWSDAIRERGPAEATSFMSTEVAAQAPKHRHELAHTYGTALYELGGIDHVAYCPHGFVYGCFHQLIGLAVAEFGLDVAGRLRDACLKEEKKERVCAHALGHALVSFYGYEESHLSEALTKCDTLARSGMERVACADGAFMEYNLREIIADGGQDARSFNERDAYAPCGSVGARFRDQCVFQLPFWWRTVFIGTADTPQIYKRMAVLCENSANGTAEPFCFAGIGFAITWFEDFDVEKIRTYCATSGTSEGELLCVSGAAHTARVNSVPHENICGILDEKGAAYCEKFVRLAREDALKLELPR